MRILSGAGHDAMHLATICPTGMIFVPCENGVSHSEIENATAGDLAAGARVLAAAMVELANA
jgi:beta-ureidopropionase / N-carbamoyl-L-amino-acid hydrolase